MDKTALTRDVVRALRQVYDPEIPVNIYDLGLIYDITIDDDHKVFIKMTMTAPNCPMSDILLEDVHTAVADTPGVTDVACGRYAGSYRRGHRDNIRSAMGQVPHE